MTAFIQLRFGAVSWRVREDMASLLFGNEGLRLQTWLAAGQASVVKNGPHRTVYRVDLGGCSVYVKHYRVPDLRALLSQCMQRSRGRREWDRARDAAEHAVPTVVPLALGEEMRGGLVRDNYLVTEAIDDVEPLDRFVETLLPALPPREVGRVQRRLTDELARLVAHVHEAGLLHQDLHAGNILVRLTPERVPQLYLIDLHAARSTRWLGWSRSRHNLVPFGLYFLDHARAADRVRFLRRYLSLRPGLGVAWRAASRELDGALAVLAQNFWRKRDGRCLSNNRRFFYRNIGVAHGFAVAELGEGPFLALLRDPDAPFRSGDARLLKDSASSTVARLTMTVAGAPAVVIYKRFNCAKRLDSLRGMLYQTPALRAWRAGHGLLTRGMPTARPLAMIERTSGPLVRESYLITPLIADAMSLDDYLKEFVTKLPSDRRRRRIARLAGELGRLVRKMHERSISHRDMKAVNFLISPAGADDAPPRLYLIDLDGVQIWRQLPELRTVQNLSRILVSLQGYAGMTRTVLLRFLRAYLPGGLHNPALWKPLWRKLSRRAAQKIARNLKLKRPIT